MSYFYNAQDPFKWQLQQAHEPVVKTPLLPAMSHYHLGRTFLLPNEIHFIEIPLSQLNSHSAT